MCSNFCNTKLYINDNIFKATFLIKCKYFYRTIFTTIILIRYTHNNSNIFRTVKSDSNLLDIYRRAVAILKNKRNFFGKSLTKKIKITTCNYTYSNFRLLIRHRSILRS